MAYFSNGTEGMVLDAQCGECALWEEPCPIALVHQLYNYDQIGNELARSILDDLVNKQGKCQLKPMIDKIVTPQNK